MNAAAAFLLALMGPDGVAIDAHGLKLDGASIESPLLQVRRSGGTTLLASSTAVEPLSAALAVALDAKSSLLLHPGLRLSRVNAGYLLETHGRRRVSIEAGGRTRNFESGVVLKVTADGLDLGGGRALVSGLIRARVLLASTDLAVEAPREVATRPTATAAQASTPDPADTYLQAMSKAAQRFYEARRREGASAGATAGARWFVGAWSFQGTFLGWLEFRHVGSIWQSVGIWSSTGFIAF